VDEAVREQYGDDCRELTRAFATYLQQPARLAFVRSDVLRGTAEGAREVEVVPPMAMSGMPGASSGAPMSSADFIWRDDGRPDWAAMWTSFCDLALFGGPPHRGEDTALSAGAAVEPLPDTALDAVAEIRRGIYETTGLFSEPRDAQWLAVTTQSPRMAAWMAAAVILENVEARFDEERLLVPAAASFTLKDEVKSVVTVVAKVHHYWLEHVAAMSTASAS
jgi:hypothetical protein